MRSRLTRTGGSLLRITKFFLERADDQARFGQSIFVPQPQYTETGWPTFDQFMYWVKKDKNLTVVGRQRETPRVWDLRNRGLGGSPTAAAFGPGFRFEIDATIADVYLRSRLDRNQLIGRPVIYIIIDVFFPPFHKELGGG